VRITGSGAGCGQNWPTCHGEVVHLPKSLEAGIELTHRLTSGLSLVFTLALFFFSRKSFAPGHRARRAAAFALVFMLGEVLIGALLVLLRLVEKDASVARAIVMPAHLVNTSLLTGSLGLSAWLAQSSRRPTLRAARGLIAELALGMAATLLVSTSGALTALGDTLYPLADTATLAQRVTGAHFLERLRWLHPLLAAATALYLLWLSGRLSARFVRRDVTLLSRTSFAMVALQTALGVFNILLSAPGYMQVMHLAAATLLWIVLVLLSAAVLTPAAAA
jgi:heme a synthase